MQANEIQVKVLRVIKEVTPLIRKNGFKIQNSNMDFDDVVQELQLKLIKFFSDNPFWLTEADESEAIAQALVVVRNYAATLVGQAVNRPDTSVYCQRVEDAMLDPDNTPFFSKWDEQEGQAVQRDLIRKIALKCRNDRTSGYDMVRFIKNALKPTPQVLAKFREWYEDPKSRNKNKSSIPPSVLGEALGFSKSKVQRLQFKIAAILVELGVEVHEIFGIDYVRKNGEEWCKSWNTSLHAQEMALDRKVKNERVRGLVLCSNA